MGDQVPATEVKTEGQTVQQAQQPAAQPAQPAEDFKNRYFEMNRKYEAQAKELEQLKQTVEEMQKPQQQTTDKVVEDEWQQWVRNTIQEEFGKTSGVNKVVRTTLDELENSPVIGKLVKKYRSELEDELSLISPKKLLEKPEIVKKAIYMNLGDKFHEIGEIKEPEVTAEPEPRKLTPLQTGTTGGVSGGEQSAGELTPEEEKFAVKRHYDDYEFTNAEIKDRYKKYTERKEKINKK